MKQIRTDIADFLITAILPAFIKLAAWIDPGEAKFSMTQTTADGKTTEWSSGDDE